MVEFQIPCAAKPAQLRLIPQVAETALQTNTQGPHDSFYFELIKLGGHLRGKNGGFYVSLLRDGLIKNGAIILIGTTEDSENKQRSRQCFRTMIQLDGDMVCKIDQHLLQDDNMDAIIEGFLAIQQEILYEFQTVSRTITLGLVGLITAHISFFTLVFKIVQRFS